MAVLARVEVSKKAAEACLVRVLGSRSFARATRLHEVLAFVGRETLAGRREELKESVVAVEVFGRDGGFNCQEDAVVRVAFRNLRARLEKYYAEEGREDQVRLEIPRSSYAPVFYSVAEPDVVEVAAPVSSAPRSRRWAAAAGVTLVLAAAWWAAAQRPSGPVRAVVVRPFTAVPGREYLAEALGEEMAAALGRISGLRVVRPSAARKLAGLEEAKRLWGAEVAVAGDVRTDSSRAWVRVRLQAVPSGKVLWWREFEKSDRDLLRARDEAVAALAEALGYGGGAGAAAPDRRRTTSDAKARDFYWQGRFLRGQWPDGLAKSIPLFERALERDPDYPETWAALAYAKAHMAFHRLGEPSRLGPDAMAAADRALGLDRRLVEAHLARGLMEYAYFSRWADAELSLRMALLADPNHAKAHNIYAIALATRGRFDEALKMMDRAEELDPLAFVATNDRGVILYLARQWDAAVARSRGVLVAKPAFYSARVIIGCALLQQGRTAEALSEMRTAYEASEKNVPVAGRYGVALARGGRTREAEEVLREAETSLAGEPGCPLEVAALMGALGHKERAMDCLERTARERFSDAQFIGVEPMLDGLAGEARFRELKRSLGL